MICCGSCNKRFPEEHKFHCMLTTLCPPCQVRDKRFSSKIWHDLVEWDMRNPEPEYNTDKCDQGFVPRCSCPTCVHNEHRQTYKEAKEQEEDSMNKQIEEFAKLYPSAYQPA